MWCHVWGVFVCSPWGGFYPPLHHRAAGSCFWRTEWQSWHKDTWDSDTNYTSSSGLLTCLCFLCFFSRMISNGRMLGGLGCLWCLGGSWCGELCRVSLWAVCWEFAHPEQSRAEQFAWLRYSPCSIHSDVKVLWGLWLPQASLSVQMMHKQKGKAAAGQGHQWGLLVERNFVQPRCWTRRFQTLQLSDYISRLDLGLTGD